MRLRQIIAATTIGLLGAAYQEDPLPVYDCEPIIGEHEIMSVNQFPSPGGIINLGIHSVLEFACESPSGEGEDHCDICWIVWVMSAPVGTENWTDIGGFYEETDWTITCGAMREEQFDKYLSPVESGYVYRVEFGGRDAKCDENGLVIYDNHIEYEVLP